MKAVEIKSASADGQLPEDMWNEERKFHRRNANGRSFYAEESTGTWLTVPLPYFEIEPTGFEPRLVLVGDRTYQLHRQRLYIPRDATSAETASLYNFLARTGYEQRMVDREFNTLVYHHLLDLVLSPQARQERPLVLDYGCGTGIGASAAAGYSRPIRLVAADISKEMALLSGGSGMSALAIDHSGALPFKSFSFDGVMMAFVSHYLSDVESYQEIHRVLKKNGRLAFNLYYPTAPPYEHISQLLKEAGYVNVAFSHSQISSSSLTRCVPFAVAEKPH